MSEPLLQDDVIRDMAIVRSMLDLGATLYQCGDRHEALEAILSQARAFTHADAGSIYLMAGDRLQFVAVQNDSMDSSEISHHLLGEELPVSDESLAGYVASTGQAMNIPDCNLLAKDLPFRINRSLDAKTGYRVKSILAIPLKCPDGRCVGVLQLFNRLAPRGEFGPFPEAIGEGVISLASQAAMALHNAGLQEQLRQVHLHTIFRLSAVAEYRDTDTGDHIHRVSRVAQFTAESLGLDGDQVELIKCASPMHDVGKVGIPDAILLKPGHLTPEQRKAMERHTVIGAEIFGNPEDALLAMARVVALRHHERWDGKGYPDGLAGEAIPLVGRIVGLADVFDAIVSKRCYKEACSLDVALDVVDKDIGSHFDPAVVKAFLDRLDDVLESYPTLKAA